jgi:glyoxylate reductase
LQKSDIISLHCPLTDETRGRFNAEALQQMKPGSILINTARGPVVDEAALAACLKSGHLFSAGLDVFEREPLIHPDLLGCKNAVLAAHIGSASTVTRLKMAQCVADNLTAMLTAKPLLTPVN